MTGSGARRFNSRVEHVPERLRERLSRLNAELFLGLPRPGVSVSLACDLLVAGVESPAAVELAGASPAGLRRVDETALVRQMLAELGVEPPDPARAPWIVARAVACDVIGGSLLPEDGTRTLWGLWWSCGSPAEILLMVEPLDVWDQSVPSRRDAEGLRAQMRALARQVVRAAEVRLAAGAQFEP